MSEEALDGRAEPEGVGDLSDARRPEPLLFARVKWLEKELESRDEAVVELEHTGEAAGRCVAPCAACAGCCTPGSRLYDISCVTVL